MAEPDSQSGGLIESLRRMRSCAFALVENRLQLFALELQSERVRLINTLLRLAVALALGVVGLLLGTFALAIYLWQASRFTGLLAMTGLFLAGAAWLFWRLHKSVRKAPLPFDKTLTEFKKDIACLTTKR